MMNYLSGKLLGRILPALLPLMLLSFTPLSLIDQPFTAKNNVKVTIQGTSNIHDWDMVSEKGTCTMTVQQDAAGLISSLQNVSFSLPVTSLKSKHGTSMDNNAYKAMDAGGHPNISFTSNTVTVKQANANTYHVSAPGKLSIGSGVRDIILKATCRVNADHSITISGSQPIKTTDYQVKPISIMLGTIKTSEDVTIQYSLTAKPQ